MKKTAKAKSVKKVISKVVPAKKSKCFCEVNQLPIVVALVAVILVAVYIMSSFYIPKRQSETYVLSGYSQGE